MTGEHELHHTPPSRGFEARMEALENAHRRLTAHVNRMEKHMATQADIDALTTKLGELKDTLTADDAGIQAEIDALKAANPAVDVSGLQSAVDALSAQVDATSALVPAPAAPPADQPPAAG